MGSGKDQGNPLPSGPFVQSSLFGDSPGSLPRATAADRRQARDLLSQRGLQLKYIRTPSRARQAVELLAKISSPLGLDTETAPAREFIHHPQAGLEPHLSQLRLVQLYGGGRQVYVFDLFALPLDVLAPIWTHPLIAHNAVFDIKHLVHAGARPRQVGCTLLMANALGGRRYGLADLVREHLNWEIPKDLQTSDWRAPRLSYDQLAYAGLDAVAVLHLYHHLKSRLKAAGRASVYTRMRDAQGAIADLELNGIFFDGEAHAQLLEAWETAQSAARENLQRILGRTINPESGNQLSQWLADNLDARTLSQWPLTAHGQLRTNLVTLQRFPRHPLVAPLMQYKETTKMISTFGSAFAEHINPVTGRIHASFRLGGTTTGRLTCSAPNIQNPPRDTRFRSLFRAPAGRVMVVADYGQIELRVAALISGDRNMLKAYADGLDLHRKTAAAVAGIATSQVTVEQRQAAKAVNFGLLYGQGAQGLARYARATYGVAMSLAQAEAARRAFFQAYPGLRRWQQATIQEARRTGHVATPGGRVREFQGGGVYSEALNTPIQGGAAEVLLATLSLLETHLAGIDALLVNLIHDEIVLEVAQADSARACRALEAAMVAGMKAEFPTAYIQGLVAAAQGPSWAEAK
jgi:DNA polymerase-1